MKRFAGKNSPSIDPSVDVILMLLRSAQAARPDSTLLTSFLQQYQERGGLSKKQLEGLYSKASKIEGISPAHLATLQAIILKKPTRYKTEKPTLREEIRSDEESMAMITEILQKYPAHKRILFFRLKLENRDMLSPLEKNELQKFHKLLLKA